MVVPPVTPSRSANGGSVEEFLARLRENVGADELSAESESEEHHEGQDSQHRGRQRAHVSVPRPVRSATPLGGMSTGRDESLARKKAANAGVGSRRERRWMNRAALMPTAEDIKADREVANTASPSVFHQLLLLQASASADTWGDSQLLSDAGPIDQQHGGDASQNSKHHQKVENDWSRIDRSLRESLLRGCRFPRGVVEAMENQLVETFLDDPSAIFVVNEPSSFNRALLHMVCQFMQLASVSDTVDGERLTTVSNPRATFTPLRLSALL